MIETRPMEANDIDKVYEIEQEAFSMPWSKASFYQELTNQKARYYVIEYYGVVAGYAGMWFVLDEAYISNIAISKEYRGLGLGKQLINQLVSVSEENNIQALTLEVRVSNTNARALYLKMGFIEVGIRKKYYQKPEEDAVIMWKYL